MDFDRYHQTCEVVMRKLNVTMLAVIMLQTLLVASTAAFATCAAPPHVLFPQLVEIVRGAGAFVSVTAAAALLVDEFQGRLLYGVVPVTGVTGRASLAERPAVGALEVVVLDADVAAATESGYTGFLWYAEESACGTHGICRILGVAAVAVMATDAVFSMDACLPRFYHCSATAALTRMALEADCLVLRQNALRVGNEHQKEQQAGQE